MTEMNIVSLFDLLIHVAYLSAFRIRHFSPKEQTPGGVFNSHKSQQDLLRILR